MHFNSNDWCMNSKMDLMLNINNFRTIRKKVWHDKSTTDSSNDFCYFSLHELNVSQAIAFIFSSKEDAELVHRQSASNSYNVDMVDYSMWNELNVYFQNGIERYSDANDYDSGY